MFSQHWGREGRVQSVNIAQPVNQETYLRLKFLIPVRVETEGNRSLSQELLCLLSRPGEVHLSRPKLIPIADTAEAGAQ